jgi:hypothetical protein
MLRVTDYKRQTPRLGKLLHKMADLLVRCRVAGDSYLRPSKPTPTQDFRAPKRIALPSCMTYYTLHDSAGEIILGYTRAERSILRD